MLAKPAASPPSPGVRSPRRPIAAALALALVAGVLALVPLVSPNVSARTTPLGSIKSTCAYSHSASDDPIVKPGQPGASHSHDFFGSPTVNAFTTLATLKAGGTTCDMVDDRSGYWVPTLYKDGVPVRSVEIAAYFTAKSANPSAVKPYPEGLRVVAGNAAATTPQSIGVTAWRCVSKTKSLTTFSSASIPTCAPGASLQLSVQFPECWDGKNLDTADHKSHLAYLAAAAATCPSTHPVLVPSLTVFALYPLSSGAGVTFASGGQYSGHGDFFNAWDPAVFADLVSSCLVVPSTCTDLTLKRGLVDLSASTADSSTRLAGEPIATTTTAAPPAPVSTAPAPTPTPEAPAPAPAPAPQPAPAVVSPEPSSPAPDAAQPPPAGEERPERTRDEPPAPGS